MDIPRLGPIGRLVHRPCQRNAGPSVHARFQRRCLAALHCVQHARCTPQSGTRDVCARALSSSYVAYCWVHCFATCNASGSFDFQ